MTRTYLEVTSNGTMALPLESKLLAERKLFLCGEVTSEMACDFTQAMIFLTQTNEPIDLFINSGGSDVDFKQIARQKTAVFVTVSDTDRSMDILANIFFTQAMQALCRYADDECADYRLPVPVRFILDDFATNCRIEEFPRMISSFRSRGISVMLLIQSEAQLEEYYDYDSRTVITNCDTYVYLGGNDVGSAMSVSKRCNKPLDSVLYMPVGSCWVFRRGSNPVFSRVFECEKSRVRG